MEPPIRNFAGIEAFIKRSPEDADGLAREWTYLTQKHPEISYFQTPSQFAIWASDPKHKVDPNLWIGKEIRDAYFYIRDRHEEKQIQENGVVDHAGVPSELLSLPFLAAAFLQRPKTFEEDPQFQKIVEKKKKEWLAKNQGKDTNSKEWIDYRYGSLENPEAETLYADAEKAFRDGEDLGEKATEKDKEQRNKKVASYDKERKKVYKNLNDDSAVVMERWRIEYHAQALIAEQKKQNPKITKEDEEKIIQQVRAHHWEKFSEKHPEKAAAYAEKHEGIKIAVAKIEEKKQQITTIPLSESQSLKINNETIQQSNNESSHQTPLPAPKQPPQPIFKQQPPPITPPLSFSPVKPSQPPTLPQNYVRPPQVSNFRPPTFRFPQQSVPFQRRFPSMKTGLPSSGGRFPTGGTIGRAANLLRPGNAASKLAASFARKAGTRLLFLIGGNMLFIGIMTAIIVGVTFGIGSPTTGEASPIDNSSGTIVFPSGTSPISATDQASFLFSQRKSNIDIYKQAAGIAGVPWEVLAGIHYIEGGFNPNGSLVSGRAIGTNEPDVRSCSNDPKGPGIPIPLTSGGCGFATLLDSAIYAGNHLKAKLNGALSSFENTVTALSRYNGGGNRNCDDNPPYQRRSPYTGCPRLYEGEDDPYVFNFFDSKHNTMYLIYCADFKMCNPPQRFSRPGIMTIIKAVRDYKQ